MSGLQLIRSLYEYNEWANKLVLAAASGLSEEELTRQAGGSYGSVAANLRHVANAQRRWLGFWEGREEARLPEPEPGRAQERLAEWFAESHEKLRRFVASLGEEDVGRILIDSRGGERREVVLSDMMIHVVNHGTQHRSETAMVLTEMGRSPGDLDFIDFAYGER